MIRNILPFTLFIFLISSCGMFKSKDEEPLRYLALGDSYTIGESEIPRNRYPNILTDKLRERGLNFAQPTIIARTGWRTDQLMDSLLKHPANKQQFELVSLLIGVNNQYQRKSLRKFDAEFNQLLDTAIARCRFGQEGVIVLSIPDYGVTPFAGEKGEQISKELEDWNTLIRRVCHDRNIKYYDITPISLKAKDNPTYLAKDQLHPSGTMYHEWVQLMEESVFLLTKANLKVYATE